MTLCQNFDWVFWNHGTQRFVGCRADQLTTDQHQSNALLMYVFLHIHSHFIFIPSIKSGVTRLFELLRMMSRIRTEMLLLKDIDRHCSPPTSFDWTISVRSIIILFVSANHIPIHTAQSMSTGWFRIRASESGQSGNKLSSATYFFDQFYAQSHLFMYLIKITTCGINW